MAEKKTYSIRVDDEVDELIRGYQAAWKKDASFVLNYLLRQALAEQLPEHLRTGGKIE